MYKKYLMMLVVLVGTCFSAGAQEANRKFVLENTQIIPIQSKHTGRAHELVIVLPASYASNPAKKYPVLYYLDAYWDTPLLSATQGNLVYDNEVPEFIMVGLSYPSTANYGSERFIDYTFPATAGMGGKGDKFLEFIKQEVVPLIESKYRGEKTGRILSGSSLGGLFTLAVAYKEPGFFAGHIAISPAAMWDNNALAKMDEAHAKKSKNLNARMFISHGTAEFPGFRDPIIQLQKQIADRNYSGLHLLNYSMEGLDHTSVKPDGYVRGLHWFWKDKKPAGPSGLERGMTGG